MIYQTRTSRGEIIGTFADRSKARAACRDSMLAGNGGLVFRGVGNQYTYDGESTRAACEAFKRARFRKLAEDAVPARIEQENQS